MDQDRPFFLAQVLHELRGSIASHAEAQTLSLLVLDLRHHDEVGLLVERPCHAQVRKRFLQLGVLHAGGAQQVSVVGEFNGWDRTACTLERCDAGVWTGVVSDVVETSTVCAA